MIWRILKFALYCPPPIFELIVVTLIMASMVNNATSIQSILRSQCFEGTLTG